MGDTILWSLLLSTTARCIHTFQLIFLPFAAGGTSLNLSPSLALLSILSEIQVAENQSNTELQESVHWGRYFFLFSGSTCRCDAWISDKTMWKCPHQGTGSRKRQWRSLVSAKYFLIAVSGEEWFINQDTNMSGQFDFQSKFAVLEGNQMAKGVELSFIPEHTRNILLTH